jgi:hypothetical protein
MSATKILTVRTIPPATMASAAAVPKSILAAVTLVVAILSRILLGLSAACNKRRKGADILSAFMATLVRLRIGLLLLMLRAILDLLVTRRKWLGIARQIRLLLRLPRRIARLLLPHERLVVVVISVKSIIASLRLAAGRAALLMRLLLIVVRVLLTKLLLRRGDQAEVVLSVLIIILGGDRITRSLRITRELDVFFRNMRSGAADFDVGTVRFVNAREGILTFAVIASPPHALLTVSHDMPVRRPFILSRHSRRTLNSICKPKQIALRGRTCDVRANDRNVVSCIAIVAATPLPQSQPQRCQPLVTRIVLGFEK